MGTKIAKNGPISAAIAHELHTTRAHGSEKLNRAGHYMRVVHYQRTSERHFWSFFLLGTSGSSPAVQGCISKCTPILAISWRRLEDGLENGWVRGWVGGGRRGRATSLKVRTADLVTFPGRSWLQSSGRLVWVRFLIRVPESRKAPENPGRQRA